MADPIDRDVSVAASTTPDPHRRRFLRAGATVGPAVLTLASQPALGVTCFTPSRSLSRNTSISQQGKYGECTGAESPGNYKEQTDPLTGKGKVNPAYHWPSAVQPQNPFHSKYGGAFPGSRFLVMDGVVERSLSFGEVLNLPGGDARDPQQVVFHLIGAYLNKLGGAGAVIPDNVLMLGDIIGIYSEWDLKDYFEPMAGIKWYAAEIKNYLVSNGLVK
jgi:hypothetical protein